jgi:Polysaccharide lyase
MTKTIQKTFFRPSFVRLSIVRPSLIALTLLFGAGLQACSSPLEAPNDADLVSDTPDATLTASGARILLSTNFDASGDVPKALYQQESKSDGVSLSSAPWDASQKALKLSINRGESWQGAGYPRSEVMVSGGVQYNKKYVFESAFYFPDGSFVRNPSEMLALFQIHHDGGGTIPLAIYMKGGGLQLAVRKNTGSGTWYKLLSSIPTGKRVPYKLEYLGASDSSGYVKVWIDNKLVAEHRGQTAYSGYSRVGYPKLGLYDYFKTVPGNLTMYLDDFRWYELN